jgi:hypothetical protein
MEVAQPHQEYDDIEDCGLSVLALVACIFFQTVIFPVTVFMSIPLLLTGSAMYLVYKCPKLLYLIPLYILYNVRIHFNGIVRSYPQIEYKNYGNHYVSQIINSANVLTL